MSGALSLGLVLCVMLTLMLCKLVKPMKQVGPQFAEDLAAVAWIAVSIFIVIVFTVIGLAFSSWFMGALWRLGFKSSPAEWIAHLVGFFLTASVVLSVFGRLVEGRWWWKS